MKRWTCCDITLLVLSLVFFVLSILGLIFMPSTYQKFVYSHLTLSRNDKTGEPGFSTFLFSEPPMNSIMKFILFNVTNPDEMIYEGAKPRVVEIGPYTFYESEEKRYLDYRDNDTQIYYQNYRRWVFSEELSCETCTYHDIVTVPNAPQMGCVTGMMDPQYGMTDVGRKIVAIGLLLLGENPFNSPRVGDLLFDGYQDPLLSAAHSPIITMLSNAFNNGVNIIPLPVPSMPTLAYFNGYNNSRDEEYWIYTGKDDVNKLGTIVTWANLSLLPEDWWTTKEARMINGSDTGQFSKPNLSKDDILPMFQSYMCRSFDAVYKGDTTVAGIHSMQFTVAADQWDTTLPQNKGFRYRNAENIDYYPDWPSCPSWNGSNCKYNINQPLDCNDAANLCDDCCDRGKLGDTYAIPPGLFPLVCYPGRLELTPFSVLWSPPHFLYSPSQVTDSIVGISPNIDIHEPMVYAHEPYSGMITEVIMRIQLSVPFFPSSYVPQNAHLPVAVSPLFWEDSKVTLEDFAYSYFKIGFIFMPTFFPWFFAALLVFSIILFAVMILRRTRRKEL